MSRRRAVTRIPAWAFVPEPLARFLRAGAFVLVLSCLAVAAWGYRVHAQLGERMIDAGSAMLQYEDVERQDARRTLLFNGQRIHLSSGTTRHSLTRVLDHYQQHCLDHDGGLTDELDASAETHVEVRLNRDLLDPIIRDERDDRGVVACLYMEELDGSAGFMERYRRYRETGDVSEVGDMRYIYAEQSRTGTHFVAFWTEGSFVLRDMLPEEGDAPGPDVGGLSRPESVRRFLSVRESGAPQKMTVYVARDGGPSATELARFYREDVTRRGWRILEPEASIGVADVESFFAAEQGERMLTFLVSRDEDARAIATILEAQ